MNKHIPDSIIKKWQNIADLLAKLIDIPAALIMKTENEFMEVYISSKSKNNPYREGDKEKWHGLYCETVIKSQKELLIPDALKDETWDKNPDIKLGMVSYLGYPVNHPDNTPFGTICVLDSKENRYNETYQQLIQQFRETIEFDLLTLDTFDIKTKDLNQTIIEQHQNLKEKNKEQNKITKALRESENSLKIANEELDIKVKQRTKELQIQNKELEESNQTKDKFFSIISHDLKSPFNTVLGFSDILLENHKNYDDEKREEIIRYVNTSANSAFKLLENLLTWSQSQSNVIKYMPEKLNLKLLLCETMVNLQELANQKNIQISDTIPENESIIADENMITTVLRNLISNAIKFTNNGGNIVVSSNKQASSNLLEISIEDTGVGIPKDKICDLFRIDTNISTPGTEEETGTGLGLILCKEFVEKNNGEIWVESAVDKGSKFIFALPIS